MKKRSTVLLALSVFLFNCTAKPDSIALEPTPSVQPSDESLEIEQTRESKADVLSDYKQTTIQTSNGEITIEPTVVSATDRLQVEDDAPLEVQILEYSDPLEFINRPIFAFNHFAYKYALIPLAKAYNNVLPKPVRSSVSNVFNNIREPLNLINNTLSGEVDEAGTNLGRFLINSTIGILGLFDPAQAWFGIEAQAQNFSQTLMSYRVGSGAYIVLPLLGQSDIRNTASIVTEGMIHPLDYALDSPNNTIARGIDGFDDFSHQMNTYVTLFEAADDPYLYFRNLYIQSTNRDEMALDKPQSEVNVCGTCNND